MGEAARFFFMLNIQVCTKDGKKLNGNLMYTIRPIGEAINYNLKKQMERNTLMERQAKIAEKVKKLG